MKNLKESTDNCFDRITEGMMRKIKILWHTSYPAPYRSDFYDKLASYCDITVVYESLRDDERNEKWFKEDTSKVKIVNLQTMPNKLQRLLYLNRLMKESDFDYVFNSTYTRLYGMAVSRLANFYHLPLVLEADGGIPGKTGIIKKIIKHEFDKADYFLSSSKYTDDYFIYYGGKKEKIYPFTFTSLTQQDLIQNATSGCKNNDKFTILSVGQIVHRKGYDLLIQAMADFPNVQCNIVGGSATQELKDLMAKYHVNNVHFIDFMKKEELSRYYKQADLFVFPTREDIWGLVINEALSFNLPILSSDNCVAAKYFMDEYECGQLFKCKDIEDLKLKLNAMINNEVQLEKYRQETIKAIATNTIEQMVLDHVSFFKQTMEIKDEDNTY